MGKCNVSLQEKDALADLMSLNAAQFVGDNRVNRGRPATWINKKIIQSDLRKYVPKAFGRMQKYLFLCRKHQLQELTEFSVIKSKQALLVF